MTDFFFSRYLNEKGLESHIFDGTLLTKMMQEIVS